MVECPVCLFEKPCLDAVAKNDIILTEGSEESGAKRVILKGEEICTACASHKTNSKDSF